MCRSVGRRQGWHPVCARQPDTLGTLPACLPALQVVLFLSVTLLALTLRFHQQMGVTRVTLSFGVVSSVCWPGGALLPCCGSGSAWSQSQSCLLRAEAAGEPWSTRLAKQMRSRTDCARPAGDTAAEAGDSGDRRSCTNTRSCVVCAHPRAPAAACMSHPAGPSSACTTGSVAAAQHASSCSPTATPHAPCVLTQLCCTSAAPCFPCCTLRALPLSLSLCCVSTNPALCCNRPG